MASNARQLKIESGIPIPPRSKRGRPKGGLTDTLNRMRIGQSIRLSYYPSGNRYYALKPKKFTARRVNGSTVRVWRTR